MGYLAGQSSVPRARPRCNVSSVQRSKWAAVLTSSSVWIPAEFWADCSQRQHYVYSSKSLCLTILKVLRGAVVVRYRGSRCGVAYDAAAASNLAAVAPPPRGPKLRPDLELSAALRDNFLQVTNPNQSQCLEHPRSR